MIKLFFCVTIMIMPKELVIALIIVGSIILLGIIAYFIFTIFISRMMAVKMCEPKHFKTKEEKDEELALCGHRDGFDRYQREPIEFIMPDNYVIHGDYSLNNPKKFVICMHGHTSNRQASLKYAYAFYRLGYSLIFFDHRSHGDNARGIVTMGYKESLDLVEIIKQVRNKFGQDIEIGLFGCSMGGVTALNTVNKVKGLSFVVSDCAFASLEDIVRGFCKQHHSPAWMHLGWTNMFLKKKYGFSFKDNSPKDELKKNKDVPILFIHGDKDDFVFPENVQMLYSNEAGPKELQIFEGANHCGSVTKDKERYYKVIEEFVNKYKRG